MHFRFVAAVAVVMLGAWAIPRPAQAAAAPGPAVTKVSVTPAAARCGNRRHYVPPRRTKSGRRIKGHCAPDHAREL